VPVVGVVVLPAVGSLDPVDGVVFDVGSVLPVVGLVLPCVGSELPVLGAVAAPVPSVVSVSCFVSVLPVSPLPSVVVVPSVVSVVPFMVSVVLFVSSADVLSGCAVLQADSSRTTASNKAMCFFILYLSI